MTQLERAQQSIASLREMFPRLEAIKEDLHHIMGEAQNRPPQGRSDGSMTEEQFSRTRTVEQALRDLTISLLYKV